MNPTQSQWPTRIAIGFGVLELLGAGLWCVAGAGIYGSPLVGLPAALAMLWNRRMGAAWLIVSGVLSGGLGGLFIGTDASVIPIVLVSLPLLVLGIWQWKVSGSMRA